MSESQCLRVSVSVSEISVSVSEKRKEHFMTNKEIYQLCQELRVKKIKNLRMVTYVCDPNDKSAVQEFKFSVREVSESQSQSQREEELIR